MRKQEPYPTDLTDKEWNVLRPLIPAVKSGGRPASYERREIVKAILYVSRTGCQWRLLPHDFPPWKIVYAYFRTWRLDGTWQSIHDHLRRNLRRAVGRHPEASAAILDSQSVKTTEKGGRAATMRRRKSKAAKGIF
jgi:putative transposase